MQRSRSMAASDDWHLVSGHSEDEGSERSMSTQAGSRPQTPAVSLNADHATELGSECPPTPESERLADTVLCAPFGTGAQPSRTGTGTHAVNSSVEACGAEVVSLHCLQSLSQEGPLEGFALQRSSTANPALPAPNSTAPVSDAKSISAAAVEVEAVEGGEEDVDAATGWQGLDGTHLAGMDALVELMEGLGWGSGCMLDACRAGLLGAQHALQMVHQTTSHGAAMARQGAQARLSRLLAFVGKLQGSGSPATGLLVSALGLTTLATLAGLVFFMGRCRHLSNALQQRDREYLRLVTKVLNLQAALTQPMSGPVLRHTTSLLSGLVTSSLM